MFNSIVTSLQFRHVSVEGISVGFAVGWALLYQKISGSSSWQAQVRYLTYSVSGLI